MASGTPAGGAEVASPEWCLGGAGLYEIRIATVWRRAKGVIRNWKSALMSTFLRRFTPTSLVLHSPDSLASTREREIRERERETSNRPKTMTAIAHRKYTFASSLTKGEGTYLSRRNHVSVRVKVILDQIVSVGRRRDLPPLPQTTNSVHFHSNHYLITHFQFSTSIGVLTAKVDKNDEVKMSAKDRVCVHTYTHKYIFMHEQTHTHTDSNRERELGGTYLGGRHHVSIRVQVIFDQGHRKRLPEFPQKKQKINLFAVYLAFSLLSGVDTRNRERK